MRIVSILFAALLVTALFRVLAMPRIEARLRWKTSAGWPVSVGRIRQTWFDDVQRGEDSVSTRLNIAFTYDVDGVEYHGQYAEIVGTPDAGHHQLSNYHSLPLNVRFNPRAPGEYILDPYRDVRVK